MIIIKRHPTDPAVAPIPDQGGSYRFELSYSDDYRRAYADTLTELCGALIEGYDPAAIAEHLSGQGVPNDQLETEVLGECDELRILYAVGVQVRLQAAINAVEPIEDLPPEQQAKLFGDRVHQPAIDHWDADIPIVLSTHDYQPYGPLHKPDGNIIWIDPRDESTFLISLGAAGIVRLAERINEDPQEATTDT